MNAHIAITTIGNATAPDGHTHKVRVYLGYDPANPYEVTLTGTPESVWTFSRDLLIDGLNGVIAGLADVQVWRQYGRLIIRLAALDDHVLLSLITTDVRFFVGKTLEAVPRGTERADVDAWLAELAAGIIAAGVLATPLRRWVG